MRALLAISLSPHMHWQVLVFDAASATLVLKAEGSSSGASRVILLPLVSVKQTLAKEPPAAGYVPEARHARRATCFGPWLTCLLPSYFPY